MRAADLIGFRSLLDSSLFSLYLQRPTRVDVFYVSTFILPTAEGCLMARDKVPVQLEFCFSPLALLRLAGLIVSGTEAVNLYQDLVQIRLKTVVSFSVQRMCKECNPILIRFRLVTPRVGLLNLIHTVVASRLSSIYI